MSSKVPYFQEPLLTVSQRNNQSPCPAQVSQNILIFPCQNNIARLTITVIALSHSLVLSFTSRTIYQTF